jgi:hypothetical protein
MSCIVRRACGASMRRGYLGDGVRLLRGALCLVRRVAQRKDDGRRVVGGHRFEYALRERAADRRHA